MSNNMYYTFHVEGISEDTFTLVRWEGGGGISEVFQFEIILASKKIKIDGAQILRKQCTMEMKGFKTEQRLKGIVFRFREVRTVGEYTLYKAIIAPKLKLLELTCSCQVFLKKSFPAIIEIVFKKFGIYNYELRLMETYEKLDYVCQFNESYLDFLSRWMEKLGIYYYFIKSGDDEKLVITDSQMSHEPLHKRTLIYRQIANLESAIREELVYCFESDHQIVPDNVHVKDYNTTLNNIALVKEKATGAVEKLNEIRSKAFQAAQNIHAVQDTTTQVAHEIKAMRDKAVQDIGKIGQLEYYTYGGNFKSKIDAAKSALIQAERQACEKLKIHAKSYATGIVSGYLFSLKDRFDSDDNPKEFLITKVKHYGENAQAKLHGLVLKEKNTAQAVYQNAFQAIPANIQFRRKGKTPIPNFIGMLSGIVTGEGSGEYAELDENGCYTVYLPFDRANDLPVLPSDTYDKSSYTTVDSNDTSDTSDKSDDASAASSSASGTDGQSYGKVCHKVPLAEPYAGNTGGGKAFGMHFPLLKNTQVLISFLEGDIDRPVIVGAMYNKTNTNPVNSTNPSYNILRSSSGNRFVMNDEKGKECVGFATADNKAMVVASSDPDKPGVTIVTTKDTVEASISDSFEAKVGTSTGFTVGANFEAFAGSKAEITAGFTNDLKLGWSLGCCPAGLAIEFGNAKSMIHENISQTSDDTITMQAGSNMAVEEYHSKMKKCMVATAVGAVATNLGTWAAIAGGNKDKDDIDSTVAEIAGSIVGGLGIVTQTVGTAFAVYYYNQLNKGQSKSFYTVNSTMGKAGVAHVVTSPPGTTAPDYSIKVEASANAQSASCSSIVLTGQAKDIELKNMDSAGITLSEGKTITLQTGPSSADSAQMTLSEGKTITLKTGPSSLTLSKDQGVKLGFSSKGACIHLSDKHITIIGPSSGPGQSIVNLRSSCDISGPIVNIRSEQAVKVNGKIINIG